MTKRPGCEVELEQSAEAMLFCASLVDVSPFQGSVVAASNEPGVAADGSPSRPAFRAEGDKTGREREPEQVSGWLTRGEGPNLASGTDRGGLRMFGRFASWRTVFRRTVRIVESFC